MQQQRLDAWERAYPLVKILERSTRFRWLKQKNAQTDIAAQQLGTMYQLASFEKAYSTYNNSILKGLCIVLITVVLLCGILPVSYLLFRQHGPSTLPFVLPMLILVTAIGLLITLGICTLYFTSPVRHERILVYENGLLQILIRTKTIQSLCWTEVEQVLKDLKVKTGSKSSTFDLLNYSICAYNGTIMKVVHEYTGRFELAKRVDEAVVSRLLPQAIQAYTTRSAIYFGDVFIDVRGLSYKGGSKFITWNDIQRLEFAASGMTVYVKSLNTSVFLDLHRRPNVCVLEGLLKYIQRESGLNLV